jgi:hypothetical protein
MMLGSGPRVAKIPDPYWLNSPLTKTDRKSISLSPAGIFCQFHENKSHQKIDSVHGSLPDSAQKQVNNQPKAGLTEKRHEHGSRYKCSADPKTTFQPKLFLQYLVFRAPIQH